MANTNGLWYLITGASKGIGRSMSVQLAEKGVNVVLLARQSEALNQTANDVQAHAPSSFSIECDLGLPSSIAQASKVFLERLSKLDGIVHNAGDIHPIKPLLEAAPSDWATSLMVNVVGAQALTSHLSPLLKGSHRTRITTISSGASLRPLASWSAYCSSKAALDMWARCLAEEGREHNISAISIAPGIVDTDMQKHIRAADSDDFPLRSTFVDYHVNGDLTQPDDVASQLLPLITEHTMEQSGQRFDVRDL